VDRTGLHRPTWAAIFFRFGRRALPPLPGSLPPQKNNSLKNSALFFGTPVALLFAATQESAL